MASELQAPRPVRGAKLWVLVSLCVASVAAAQPAKPNPDAERHHQRGLAALRAEPKDFTTAAAEFAAAYAIDPRPRYLFNLALAQRLGGACRKAIESYRAYLDTHPPESYAGDARTGIERCEKLLAAEADVPLAVDPKPAEPPRLVEQTRPDETRPGTPGTPATPATPGAARPGAGPDQSADLVAHSPSPARGPWYRDRAGTALVVTGAAAGIAGAVCYVLARRAAAATFDPGTLDDYESNRGRAGALQTASWITTGAGAALIAGGVIRYATRPAARRGELALRPTTSGIALVLGGRF
jgi:hypothetical protein